MFEIDERLRSPKAGAQFLARDQLTWPFQENTEHLDGLTLQPHPGTVLQKLARSEIGCERSEPNDIGMRHLSPASDGVRVVTPTWRRFYIRSGTGTPLVARCASAADAFRLRSK